MIDLHYWPTPNGHKITLFLEEAGLEYVIHPVDIGAGDQFRPEYLQISPNNKMPAIVDRAPADGGAPISVFESGAILLYLANKTGKFILNDPGTPPQQALRGRIEVNEWLFWQVGGLGPMTGQYGHFHVYAPDDLPYAKDRYQREVLRLLGVLDRRLERHEYVAGAAYSIADMAIHPWINPYTRAPLDLEPFAHVRRWHAAVAARPAVQRAYAIGQQYGAQREMTPEMRKILFGTPPPQ